MNRIVMAFLSGLLCVCTFADELPSESPRPNRLQITVCTEGAAVINAAEPAFAYGGGLRYYMPVNPEATFIIHGEYMRRNTYFNMSTIDISGLVTFGHAFYYGLGLYVGYVLNMEQARGWETTSSADIGWVADIGYHFGNTGITSGFSVHMGLSDLQPNQINLSGYINQINIRWGLWFGYQIL